MNFISVFSGSANNVIKNVVLGKVDAGAVFVSELEMEPKEIQEQLRPLVMTRKVAPHPLCAHPRIPPFEQEAVRKAVLAIAKTDDGAKLLRSLRLTSPVLADYAKDYRALEVIDVRGLANWGE